MELLPRGLHPSLVSDAADPTWATLFERAEADAATLADVRAALAEVRDEQ